MQKKGVMFPLLDGILRAMDEIDNCRASLDDILDNKHLIIPEMRRTAAHWLFSIYRYRLDIEHYIRVFARKGTIKNALFQLSLASLAHCAFQNSIAREKSVNAFVEYAKVNIGLSEGRFLNALLRKFCREEVVFSPRLTKWCRKKWLENYGDDFINQAMEILKTEAEPVFRMREKFSAAGLDAELFETEILTRFKFYRTKSLDKCINSECFKKGGIYIQDTATGVPVEMAAKYINFTNGKFIDVCGAPGGKAIMFHDLFPEWEITIADVSKKRQNRTLDNLKRCRIRSKLRCCNAASCEFTEKYDVVLADVPCSNSGVFRKRPDVLFRLNDAEVAEMVKIQRSILENIFPAVGAGGLLVYSTCSIEPEEDSEQIAAFLAAHPGFVLLEEKLTLPNTEHDGSYCACMRRKA